jgi:hypothetical protein
MTKRSIFLAVLSVFWIFLWWGVIGVFLTDPYSPFSTVQSPYQTEITHSGNIELVEKFAPNFDESIFAHTTAYFRAGTRIGLYRWIGEPKISGDHQQILNGIHQRRFQATKPYVITGAHYSDLYVRNLGIFYNELLTPLPDHTAQDWQARQRIALQTVALDLAYLRSTKKLVTTVVPLGGRRFTGVNIYAEPSDSLHAVLFTLDRLLSPESDTVDTTKRLVEEHRASLQAEVKRYITTVIDPETLMVKENIHLSSARDGVQRKGAFYDTVIAWKTLRLAQKLGVIEESSWPSELSKVLDTQAWKERIIARYWQPEAGIFANDLYDTEFSADSLIVLSAGFLNPLHSADRRKLERVVTFIQEHKLDQPFPLRYSRSTQQNELHLAVRLFAPAYMGESIWSHWGIEYIKTLLALSQSSQEDHCVYLEQAQTHLNSYHQNIEQFGGYPELYDGQGQAFKTVAVRGVLHTGWVVNYEAAHNTAEKYLSSSSCDFKKGLLQ